MFYKTLGSTLGVLALTVGVLFVRAQPTQDTAASNENKWKDEWKKKEAAFQETLKTLKLKSAQPADCIGISVMQTTMGGNGQGEVQILAPVPRSKIRAVRAFAREEAPSYPWWECPIELGKQCGQIATSGNPNGDPKPGGIAFLPYSVVDTDDNKTLVRAGVLAWGAGGKVRDIRFEVDYLTK